MTLTPPTVDTRTYDDLVDEALRRVTRYAPEWRDHNASDPGRALINVNAWLTETLLYQLNRVPEQNYIAFLNLLNITPRAARAAQTDLAFKLKPLSQSGDRLQVAIPNGTKLAVDDPDLDQEVVFETQRAAVALNAAVGFAATPAEPNSQNKWNPVLAYDNEEGAAVWLHSFHPFGAQELASQYFVFALVLRPTLATKFEDYSQDRFPSGELDLFIDAVEVFDTDPAGNIIPGPLSLSAGVTGENVPDDPSVNWEIFTGTEVSTMDFSGRDGWQSLSVSHDETDGMKTSGHIRLEIPVGATALTFSGMSAELWNDMGYKKPPHTAQDLKDDLGNVEDGFGDALKAVLDEDLWLRMGVPTADFNAVLASCTTGAEVVAALEVLEQTITLTPDAISAAEWAEIYPPYTGPAGPLAENNEGNSVHRRMYYIRAKLLTPISPPRMLNGIRLNSVKAVAASTRLDEKLGLSNGRPGQEFSISRTPVFIDPNTNAPDFDLHIQEGLNSTLWTRVDDFYGASPADEVYQLDPISGTIQFGEGRGNGRGGAIPPAGASIRASRYRFGGGAIANVGANTVTKIKGALRDIDSVTNPRAVANGSDAETLDEVLLRAPNSLRNRERAVSAQDFADLAKETPGAAVHKAYAVGAHRPTDTGFEPKAGAVSLVVLPNNSQPAPQPSEAQLCAVSTWLEPRRLVTTELFVTGPRYFEINRISVQLRIDSNSDIEEISTAACSAIVNWLHPIHGGQDGTGWPFGTDVFHGDIYDLLLHIPGVRRVARLSVQHQQTTETAPSDVVPIPQGHLPLLIDGAIDLEVIYDTR